MRLKYILFLILTVTFLKAELTGAIEGDVKVNQGKLTYTFPLSLPKGAFNLAPNLTISYNQGSNDGYLGLGFNLSGLSTISRCGSVKKIDGFNGGVEYNENAHYCLDGVRLIKIDDNSYRPNTKT